MEGVTGRIESYYSTSGAACLPSGNEWIVQEAAEVIRPYRPSLLIVLSGLLHVLALVLLLIDQRYAMGVALGLLLNHALLTVVGLWPRSSLLGPNTLQLSSGTTDSVYLTFDDGPNPEITPKILDLLDDYGCRGTFFVIGKHVRKYPDLVREIVRRGHAIGNHSDQHGFTFAMHSIRGYTEELLASQQAIFDAVGLRPRYFRAPFGFRSPLLEPALCRTGLHLMSWTRRGFDTRCNSPQKILNRLIRKLQRGDILLLHDGPFGRQQEGEKIVLSVLPQVLKALRERGLRSEVIPHAYSRN